MSTILHLMTTDEFLAIPDDGKERWLIKGELRERPMTYRNRFHSITMTEIVTVLNMWVKSQSDPKGRFLTGDAGVRLKKDPDTVFGIDIVYVSNTVLQQQTEDTTIIDGIPIMAIEILSPNDKTKDVDEKIEAYLEAGVMIWIVNTSRKSVMIYRPNLPEQLFTKDDELVCEPELPGFRVHVSELFL